MHAISIIKGEIIFGTEVEAFSDAALHVYLEKLSLPDAEAVIEAYYINRNAYFDPDSNARLSFEIAFRPLSPSDRYAVRVHIDMTKDGKLSKGDLITMQSYHVISHTSPKNLAIVVRQIT